jgi:predicted DNA-binding transcriptional regulator YafY
MTTDRRSIKLSQEGTSSLGASLPMGAAWYRDLTPPQRLCTMLLFLMSGKPLHPTEYAERVGVSRVAVYGQLRSLSQMGVPVVRVKKGHWTLLQFFREPDPFDESQLPDVE